MHLAAEFDMKKAAEALKPAIVAYALACLAYLIIVFLDDISGLFSSSGVQAALGLVIMQAGQFVYLFAIVYLLLKSKFDFVNKLLVPILACIVASTLLGYFFDSAGKFVFGSAGSVSGSTSAAFSVLPLVAYFALLAVLSIAVYYVASGKYENNFMKQDKTEKPEQEAKHEKHGKK
ncbi:MAG TPA: hypothetical protein PLO51_06155, partial [Candidatus Micrarchaeota archaeon]|nr:hypothetical protein [Candidatus Micrarchaeota archaeon]